MKSIKNLYALGSMKTQAGMSYLQWVTVLMVISIFATVGLKLIPIYTDNRFIGEVLSGVAEDAGAYEKSPAEIRSSISKRFTINNIRDVNVKDIKINKDKGKLVIEYDYEIRVNVFENIDAVVWFNERHES